MIDENAQGWKTVLEMLVAKCCLLIPNHEQNV
jgi:hypothetical protein